jgi:hypothetical protein
MKELGTLRGYQVSSEVRQKMEQSLTSNVGKIYGLKIKLMSATFQDKTLDTKLNQLVDDYTALVKGEAPGSASKESPAPSQAAQAPEQKTSVAPAPAPSQNPEQLKAQLLEVLGDSSTWKSAAMAPLQPDMTCDQVHAAFPALEPCETKPGFVFAEAPVSGHPILARYKFSFQDGKLYDATLIFRRNLDREQFKSASLELFESKWGALKPEKRSQDILTSIGPNFSKAQRVYMVSEWQISHDFPKE